MVPSAGTRNDQMSLLWGIKPRPACRHLFLLLTPSVALIVPDLLIADYYLVA